MEYGLSLHLCAIIMLNNVLMFSIILYMAEEYRTYDLELEWLGDACGIGLLSSKAPNPQMEQHSPMLDCNCCGLHT